MNEGEATAAAPSRVNIAGIQYQPAGKVFDFDSGDLELMRGQAVVVETDRGPALGLVAWEPQSLEPPGDRKLKRVLRIARPDDLATASTHRERAAKAVRLAIERARYYRLKFKVVAAEFPLKGDRVIFYYSSEDRVDYRPLVKDLGHELRARVEMRQIGPRDVAKTTGGIGPCGLELCCSTWLREFQPVSIKMAKDQGLALNPQKVSGACGRLLCCLDYEHEGYVENKQGMPKIGKFVQTEVGRVKVTSIDILNRTVRGLLEDGSTEEFSADDVTILKGPQPQAPPPGPRGRESRRAERERPRERRTGEDKPDASSTPEPRTDEPPKPDEPKREGASDDAAPTPRKAEAQDRAAKPRRDDDKEGKPRRRRRRRRRRSGEGNDSGPSDDSSPDSD